MWTGWIRIRSLVCSLVRVRLALQSSAQEDQELSALGETFEVTPLVIPILAHLDSMKRLLKGDIYIGRGSKQRGLPRSRYCNNFKMSEHGRVAAIASFRDMLHQDSALHASLWTLSGTLLVCHCRANEACHGDVLVEPTTARISNLPLQIRQC